MSEVLKNFDLIENYFEGKLSNDEKTSFETRLIIDSSFKDEVELYKNIVAGIKETGEANLKAKLKLVDNELDTEPVIVNIKLSNSSRIKYLAIAASIVLIIGISVFINLSNKSSLPKLAVAYYEKEKGLPNEMSESESPFIDIMNSYKTDDYVATKNKLDTLLKQNSTNDTLRYFYGISNYELKNYRTAIASFNMITAESNYYQKAQYRLVLIELLLDNKQKAIKKIDECLANNNHIYYDKLIQLRTELSK